MSPLIVPASGGGGGPATGTSDTPVLDNGLVRVRYDASVGYPGWRVDVWNGSAYVEQGKMVVQRIGDSTTYCDTWQFAGLIEYTPDRAVMLAILNSSTDAYSRERVFITLQRGELSVAFECYPALTSGGGQADCVLQWTPALNSGAADLNNSAVKIDSAASGATTVAAASNGVNVNTFTGAGTLHAASTTGYAGTGTLAVQTGSGTALITYTGASGGNFTGCALAGGITGGTLSTGGVIAPYAPGSGWTPGAAGTAITVATAGTGAGTGNSGQFSSSFAAVGVSNFAGSENWVALLRCPTVYNTVAAYQATLIVLQSINALCKYAGSSTTAYGTGQDSYQVMSQNGAGYLQCQIGFAATVAQQVLEGESMTLGTGTTTTSSESGASGASSAQSTSTTANHVMVSQATWPNSFAGTFRVFVRAKTSASTLNVRAVTGTTTGTTVTTTSATYVWLDLGEIVANGTLQIQAWATAAATFNLDRLEAVLVVDQARTAAIYSGSRDMGQAALQDSRALGVLVART